MTRSWWVVAILAGCGGGGGTGDRTLDCAWATSDGNCWLSLLDTITPCAVPDGAVGVFDATRTHCTYAEGWVVSFDEPVPVDVADTYSWRFTVSHDGAACVRYTDTSTDPGVIDLEVESNGQLVAASGSITDGLTVTCPDGISYHAADPYAVLTCGDPRGYKIPGVTTFNSGGGTVGLSIPIGEEPGGADIDVPLFSCR